MHTDVTFLTKPLWSAKLAFSDGSSIRTTVCESLRSLRKSTDARVAQIFNLLYRRFSTCGPGDNSGAGGGCGILPIANRRYSRVQLSATLVAALPRGVHPWFNLREKVQPYCANVPR
jgi:hypothetical protein